MFDELVLAWVEKADGDFHMAQREMRTRSLPYLEILEDYAVLFRYPGMSADKKEAKEALDAAKNVRIFLRQRLSLP